MNFLGLLLFLAGAAEIAADGPEHLQLGTPHRLIGNKVRVRAKPDTKAEAIAELSIGSEITPTVQTDSKLAQDGVEAPWYKVTFSKEGKRTEGYIWGNLIAKSFSVSKEGLVFLYGIGPVKKDQGYEQFSSQLRVAKDSKELAKLIVAEGVPFASRAEVKAQTGRGFSGVQNVISVHFMQEYCGGKGNTMYIFWNGKELNKVHSTIDGADAPVYAIETLTFPDDKGGKSDQLFVVQEYGDHDNPKEKKIEKFWLKWNGKKLVKGS